MAEGAALEMLCAGNRTASSNLALSAFTFALLGTSQLGANVVVLGGVHLFAVSKLLDIGIPHRRGVRGSLVAAAGSTESIFRCGDSCQLITNR